jgi:hypothetical protein
LGGEGIERGRFVKLSTGVAIAISLSLVSCAAKKAPTRIAVTVADSYAGSLHLRPCVEGANAAVVTDAQGNGATSACPYGDVEIVLTRQNRTIYIMPEAVRVERTADGIPVTITAEVP